MAKDRKDSYNKPTRNRGENVGKAPRPRNGYDYEISDQYQDRSQERPIKRREIRQEYDLMYRDAQERDQRAFDLIEQLDGEFWRGVDPRRRQEVADGGLIQEDHTQMANLPRRAIHHEYPKAGYYESPYIDDARRGDNSELDDDGVSDRRFLNKWGR